MPEDSILQVDFTFVLTYGNKTVIWTLLLILATSRSALINFSERTGEVGSEDVKWTALAQDCQAD
jgi:hypothetical protein